MKHFKLGVNMYSYLLDRFYLSKAAHATYTPPTCIFIIYYKMSFIYKKLRAVERIPHFEIH